ncbi:hypothetical protein J3R30DRAFT_3747380 [Lentinula aciculospora]|uniref:G domain-containing protein n=1 Tax=Lentinula aciculospora TaxID=153920 RepID=A0A9W9DX51_9AGAR|nr:hypothetical protein J3R30DRAFT_3747380 [Lentinula aciculospora]
MPFHQVASSRLSPSPLNIIFFGSTKCGKSPIVNILLGHDATPMSSDALGCTFENNVYTATIEGREYRLFDTTGLNEGTVGTVVSQEALIKLYYLSCDLHDGISLLVYCMRGPKITETLERNYNIFYDGFCRKTVPIVIAWAENEHAFADYNMNFDGHACITATFGKRMKNGEFRNQAEYDESQVVLRDLIVEQSHQAKPWKLETSTWFVAIAKWLYRNMPSWLTDHLTLRLGDLYEVLKRFLHEKDARDIAKRADLKPAPAHSPKAKRANKKVAPAPAPAIVDRIFAFT